jgi:glycosyltransferase involved in cell wall biosynthesis
MVARFQRTELRRQVSEVVPYSVDSDTFRPREVSRESVGLSNGPLALFAGNMYSEDDHRKGLHDLLAAWPIVRTLHPNAQLVVAGAIKGISECPKGVRPMGVVSRNQMLDLYQTADLFCLPSHGDNSPLSVLEAMSCGLPIVATKVGGIPEQVTETLLQNGRPLLPCGVLASRGNPREFADHVITLFLDEAQRTRMGEAGRDRVLARWSRSKSAEAHMGAYQQMLNAASSKAP